MLLSRSSQRACSGALRKESRCSGPVTAPAAWAGTVGSHRSCREPELCGGGCLAGLLPAPLPVGRLPHALNSSVSPSSYPSFLFALLVFPLTPFLWSEVKGLPHGKKKLN